MTNRLPSPFRGAFSVRLGLSSGAIKGGLRIPGGAQE